MFFKVKASHAETEVMRDLHVHEQRALAEQDRSLPYS